MELLHSHCCGLDVHKKSIVACVLTPNGKETQTFGTMTRDLYEMVYWIRSHGCTAVAMEATGVYWKPVYNLLELEENLEVSVVNAQHIKTVPGRKKDVKDAEWIANLCRHGLITPSFIPSREQRELRDLTRLRKSMIEERSSAVNRIQKTLESCNIKIASVITDVMGVTGRGLLETITAGVVPTAEELDRIVKGRARSKIPELELALEGMVGTHQCAILKLQLRHVDGLNDLIEILDRDITERLSDDADLLELLVTVPGIGLATAQCILAEIGTDMTRFPSQNHLASWAGMAPGNNESAGKRKSGKTKKGNAALRSSLVESGRSAARTKDTYLSSKYKRISARRGANRAAVAVGRTILVIVYNIIKNRVSYRELGGDYLDQRNEIAVAKNAIKRLESLGYDVTATKKVS